MIALTAAFEYGPDAFTWVDLPEFTMDNRIFSPHACSVCGRLGQPHAEFCPKVTEELHKLSDAREHERRANEGRRSTDRKVRYR